MSAYRRFLFSMDSKKAIAWRKKFDAEFHEACVRDGAAIGEKWHIGREAVAVRRRQEAEIERDAANHTLERVVEELEQAIRSRL